MRTFRDRNGRRWQVAVGRESYGVRVLLFTPLGASGVRKLPLESRNSLDAGVELAALSVATLRDRLERSVPWDGSGD